MRETAYGIIPLRQHGSSWEVFVVRHCKGHWGFPKGHAEGQELPQQTAARELLEETSLAVVRILSTPPLQEHYHFSGPRGRVDKTVVYFMAEIQGRFSPQEQEIVEGRWLSLGEAQQLITFAESRACCTQAAELLSRGVASQDFEP